MFDILVSLEALLLLLPLFALIALVIKLDSSGPVFYRGIRIGQYGVPFRMCKFRSMVVGADATPRYSVGDDDERITTVGHFLRSHKLDELPQLLNVLKGEMSIVGPRPEVPSYVAMFTDEERAILSVKPGMTDWASIWDYNEGALLAHAEDAEQVYKDSIRPQKLRLQQQYIRERSFLTDMRIIVATVQCLTRRA